MAVVGGALVSSRKSVPMDPVVRQVVLAVGGTKLGSRGRRRCLVAIWVDCDVRERYHVIFRAWRGDPRVSRSRVGVRPDD